MHTILSWGMGVESTAILVRWLLEPGTRPCALDELLVLTAQTGDEYADTGSLCERYILPLLRRERIRFVEVARRGHLEKDGIVVLADSRSPDLMHMDGAYKLSDELRAAGTVPQFGGEHRCSLKFKAFVIETWLRENFQHSARHAFGYSLEEPKRVAKSEQAIANRVAFGFSTEELGRADRAASYDRPNRTGFYPLIEWGWTRQMCLDYLSSRLGVVWEKSACVYCPFNQLGPDALRRHKQHAAQVADALELELVSLTLNPRGMLYKKQSLYEYADQSGNTEAIAAFEVKLSWQSWRVYRVRRIYGAKKNSDGKIVPERKGLALRAVEHISGEVAKTEAMEVLRTKAEELGAHLEFKRGIGYLYQRRAAATYPTREEYFVAGPAVVGEKARYGMEWFEEQWEARQTSLFSTE